MSGFDLNPGTNRSELLRGLEELFSIQVLEESWELLTYWDTFDWRLLRSGVSLTTSRSGRLTRICVNDRDGCVLEGRLSKSLRFVSDAPPGPIQDTLHPIAGRRRLLPRGQAEWESTLVSVLNEDGKTVVRLLLRTGEALLPEVKRTISVPPRLRCLPLVGYRKEEKRVVSFLRKRYGMEVVSKPELAVVCAALGQTPGAYSSSFDLTLSPEISAAAAMKKIHQVLLRTMVANQEGIEKDWDSEFLHDFRVAVRRTRSALSQLRGLYPEDVAHHFSQEFRWLGHKTGTVRDLDVYLLNIPAYRSALQPTAKADLEPLVRLLREKKRVEHRRLRGCLRSKRYNRLIEDWLLFLEAPTTPSQDPIEAHLPVQEVASNCIWNAFTKILERGGEIDGDTPAKVLHRLRIDCKKLRYLITFFHSLYPESALAPIIKELKKLQDHLGAFNDLQVQREALQGFAEEMMTGEMGPPATLLAMGQLMGQLGEKQIQEREALRHYFPQFSRRKAQRRFKVLFGPNPVAEKRARKGKHYS